MATGDPDVGRPADSDEDLIDAGSERRAVLGARLRRHPLTRIAAAVAAAALAVLALNAVRHDPGDGRSAAPTSRATVRPSAPVSSGRVDDEYLYAVPAGDLRAVLAEDQCATDCTAHSLTGPALLRAASAFPGLTPVAGGTVTRSDDRVIFESVEGRAEPDALVHLVLRRTGTRTAAPTVRDDVVDGARTVTIRQRRGGWLLTASVLVRGTLPPQRAAVTWSATTTLPT